EEAVRRRAFTANAHDFGHAEIALVDHRLPSDALDRARRPCRLRFPPCPLVHWRAQHGDRHWGRFPRAGCAEPTAETAVASILWFGGRGRKARKRRRMGTSIFAPHPHKFS